MFEYHTKETAPAEAHALMEQSRQDFGMLPNLHRILAESPETYRAYLVSFSAVMAKSEFSPLEAQVIFMTANYENKCHYCTAGHSWAMEAAGMPADVIEALREGKPIADPKLQALRAFTQDMLETRGHLPPERLQEFLDAGYTRKQALEVICGLASKVISNYTNALARTELDPPMQSYSWVHPDDR